MANTTFSGPVRSENGFQSISVNSTTGAVTVNSSFGSDVVLGTQSLSGAGAVNVTSAFTALTTTGSAQALTLANGNRWRDQDHHPRCGWRLRCSDPHNQNRFQHHHLHSVGESAMLVYTAAGWAIVCFEWRCCSLIDLGGRSPRFTGD